MSTEIGIARERDVDALIGLLNQLFEQETQFQTDESRERAGLLQIICNPSIGHILVARENQVPVGMVSLLYTVSTARGSKVALLEDFIVDAAQRNNGFGHALLDAAIAHAKKEGCTRVALLTSEDNFRAHALYRKKGFQSYGMTPMRINL